MTGDKVAVRLKINGVLYERSVEARCLLADFIRHEAGLTGTHIGCEQGVCGACTVLLDGQSARSCLHFAVAVQHCDITTIEGLDGSKAIARLQDSFRRNHALQCGFCTPGFLVTAHELLNSNHAPTEREVRKALTNNLCRCTGYTPIIDAVLEASHGPEAST